MAGPASRRLVLAGGCGLLAGCGAGEAKEIFEITKSEAEWRRILPPERFAVLRQENTERPRSSPLNAEKRRGIYACAGCALPVYRSETKFESGTGWPSFTDPKVAENVETREDRSLFMKRTEVLCRRCGGHLGHVFDDGPRSEGGKRYCINSCALELEPAADSS